MKDTKALRPEDVTGELGMSATQIRNLMRLGRFKPPIGYAIKTTASRYRYSIYRPMLDEYLHKPGKEQQVAELMTESLEERKALRKVLEELAKEIKHGRTDGCDPEEREEA